MAMTAFRNLQLAGIVLSIMLNIVIPGGCTICTCKKVPCAGYNNPMFDSWFPYDSGDVKIFSGGSVTDTFSFSSIYETSNYEAGRGCIMHSDPGCSSVKDITSLETNGNTFLRKFQATFSASSDWNGNISGKSCAVSVYGFSVDGYDISDTGIVFKTPSPSAVSTFNPSVSLSGKTYQSVQVFVRDTAGLKEGVYKIYIQKNAGVLAYEMYPSKTLFIRK
jgi:hypothetical protein